MYLTQQRAVAVIGQVLDGHNLNQVLDHALNGVVSPQARGALQDLSYGTLRFYGQLRQVLLQLLNKPIQDTRIEHLLLVALYQLQYSKAAPYAVVDHAVRAAKEMNSAASGLVNAVLRNYLRRHTALLHNAEKTAEGRFSYPQWWITAIQRQYGAKAEQILLAGNRHPPMILRVNQARTTVEKYLERLAGAEIPAQLIQPDAVRLMQPISAEKIPGFLDGEVSIQDAGAQYAAKILDAKEEMLVLDACSAPGGKSGHILELASVKLTAVDKDELRLQKVRENLARIKQEAILICGDAAQPQDWWDGCEYDRILADVPCSGSGVVRRHPDIKWLRRPSDIEGFAKQQSKILEALWPLLKHDGKLLYATCSVFSRENQQVIDEFIKQHPDAEQIKLAMPGLTEGQLLPNDEHDGFFYALLQKKA